MSTDNKKRIDHFEIIGRVMTQEDTGERFLVTIEESNGKEFKWKAFHASEFRGKLTTKEVYHFKVSHAHEDGRQWPWRNLDGLIGPVEMPASGEMTSYRTPDGGAAGSPTAPRASGGSFTPEAKIIERQSIEASQALMIQVDLLKAGFTIDEIPDVLDKMIENAKAINTYYEGKRPELVVPAAPADVSKPAANEKAAKIPEKIGHVGDFLTYCLRKHNLTRANVEDIVGDLDGVTEWDNLVIKIDEDIAQRFADLAKAAA